MALTLPASVYTAHRGYAWSAIPAGLAPETLENFLADALSLRPDFSDETDVTAGIVARDGLAAAFTVRRATAWDAVGRDADYAAFTLVPFAQAASVDFAVLLTDAFFQEPSRTPPALLTYAGPAAEDFPLDAPGRILCHHRLEGFNPHAAGALLARYGGKADQWFFRAEADHTFTVTSSPWHR